jgi:hypothetical protein
MRTLEKRKARDTTWAEREEQTVRNNVGASYPFARSMLDETYDIDMQVIEMSAYEHDE